MLIDSYPDSSNLRIFKSIKPDSLNLSQNSDSSLCVLRALIQILNSIIQILWILARTKFFIQILKPDSSNLPFSIKSKCIISRFFESSQKRSYWAPIIHSISSRTKFLIQILWILATERSSSAIIHPKRSSSAILPFSYIFFVY